MSEPLKLRVLVGEYESVRALREGVVQPDGIELDFVTFPGTRAIHQMLAGEEGWDIGEFNVGAFISDVSLGRPVTGLPVYLHRRFRHGFAFINNNAGIKEPKDLIGKRIGGTNFAPAGNLWVRGILENDYGVDHKTITWVTERDEDGSFEYPDDLKIERIGKDQDLDEMLLSGEIDAMISPGVPEAIEERDPRVSRLFPDYKDREIAYFNDTGIFPIMHVTMIRREVVDENPWIVEPLVTAFEKAKNIAYERLANPRIVPLAWYQTAWEEQQELLGADPWEYGLTPANRHNLQTIIRYVHQQGLTEREMTIEEIFAPGS